MEWYRVQVEMESITIGGMAMTLWMETNSFRSGLFQETVVAYEIITSKGELMKVTEESDPELVLHRKRWSSYD